MESGLLREPLCERCNVLAGDREAVCFVLLLIFIIEESIGRMPSMSVEDKILYIFVVRGAGNRGEISSQGSHLWPPSLSCGVG